MSKFTLNVEEKVVETYHGNISVNTMGIYVQYTWQLDMLHHVTCIFVSMLHFPFGNHMATVVDTTWQL